MAATANKSVLTGSRRLTMVQPVQVHGVYNNYKFRDALLHASSRSRFPQSHRSPCPSEFLPSQTSENNTSLLCETLLDLCYLEHIFNWLPEALNMVRRVQAQAKASKNSGKHPNAVIPLPLLVVQYLSSTDQITLDSCCLDEGGGPYRALTELTATVRSVEDKVNCAMKANTLAPFAGTNHSVISPQEREEIHRRIANSSLLSHELDHAIYRLQSLRNNLHLSTKGCKRLLSAVGRLPAEILSCIFLLIRPQYLGITKAHQKSIVKNLRTSFNPAQVCRHWRTVALNTPRLWNVTHLKGIKDVDENKICEQLEILSRTGPIPPYLVVRFSQEYEDFLRRCQSHHVLSAFQQKCTGLDVYVKDILMSRPPNAPIDLWLWLQQFSRLQSLALLNIHFPSSPPPSRIRWDNLTHLQLHLNTTGHLDRFLSGVDVPKLRVLVVKIPRHMILNVRSVILRYPELTTLFLRCSVPDEYDPFIHPHLQRVAFYSSARYTHKFLISANLPSITELAISVHDQTEKRLTDFALRSQCHIKRLTFLNRRFDKGHHERSGPKTKRLREMGNTIAERLSVPKVEFNKSWGSSQMMRELKWRWYQQPSAPGHLVHAEEDPRSQRPWRTTSTPRAFLSSNSGMRDDASTHPPHTRHVSNIRVFINFEENVKKRVNSKRRLVKVLETPAQGLIVNNTRYMIRFESKWGERIENELKRGEIRTGPPT
ncbi:hypothetical protein CONPUDRAFT_69813 [Coniophora puteana RWD-64-598 SS2]|uniref:Uncharacterized protein n=1 Tax=Coniophora puteana (strain RWD-64-598) TaxID=741705 RepID=A0A5M3N0A6_CONPW|nr:uncharacterized protein CONPUDRAFT_69813 [Coniophora puteana RWD-64-598 SS2]EIW84819.1 hypothetical protein CONPUDRAFT_69813 [Coniophora puteana RWD-64-598 SS2]